MTYLKPSLLIVTGALALLPAVGCSGRNAHPQPRPVRVYQHPTYASPHSYQPQYEATPIAPSQLPTESYQPIEPQMAPPVDGMLPAPADHGPAPGSPSMLPPMPEPAPMPSYDSSTSPSSRPGLLPRMTRRMRGLFSRDKEPTATPYQSPTMQSWPTPEPVINTSQQGPTMPVQPMPVQPMPTRWSNAPSA